MKAATSTGHDEGDRGGWMDQLRKGAAPAMKFLSAKKQMHTIYFGER